MGQLRTANKRHNSAVAYAAKSSKTEAAPVAAKKPAAKKKAA